MTVYANAQPGSSNLAFETDSVEASTVVGVEVNGAEGPETDNPRIRENNEICLPSARRLSVHRSRKSRRNIITDTRVEIVVHGCEGDAQEVAFANGTFRRDEAEEEEDQENEVLQLQDRLLKQRCVMWSEHGVVHFGRLVHMYICITISICMYCAFLS